MSTITQSSRGQWLFTCPDRSLADLAIEFGMVRSNTADDLEHTWDKMIEELICIRNLKDDWDGEGTEAPRPALVDGAITLAQNLNESGWPAAERVSASVNGTVYFEWHMPLGYQEIEVTSPLEAESRWVRKGSDVVAVIGLICHSYRTDAVV